MITYICVKLQANHCDELRALIVKRREEFGWSYSELARQAAILPSHARIICLKPFHTLSHSVTKICAALKIDLTEYGVAKQPLNSEMRQIQEAALLLWDRDRAGDAQRVIALLEQLARLRNLPRPPRRDGRAQNPRLPDS